MSEPLLSPRALNRATLARQLLLERASLPLCAATERLAGLNAQLSTSPYVTLWSRLVEAPRDALEAALDDRSLLRATLMRCTIHVVTQRDYRAFAAALMPALARSFRSYFKEERDRLDLAAIAAAARAAMDERPRTFPELRELLAPLAPGEDPNSLSFAARSYLPLVNVPPAGRWRWRGSPAYTHFEAWIGGALDPPEEARRHLLRRYLAAFGPSTREDAETWSGLSGLRPVLDELAPELVTFCDEQGRRLYDLADAPRPEPDTPAPPRFLPDWDNFLIGHADRTRVLPEPYRKRVIEKNGHVVPTFLLDGVVAGAWRIERAGAEATLLLEPFVPGAAPPTALLDEGERLLRWHEPDATQFSLRVT